MKRRLYFLIPDVTHLNEVIHDLEQAGVQRNTLHVCCTNPKDAAALQDINIIDREDLAYWFEWGMWRLNLLIFFLALFALVLMATGQFSNWIYLPVGIMLVTFLSGWYFAAHVPNVHLNEFTEAMKHREVLLIIDIDYQKVKTISDQVHHQHPEAVTGGVSWMGPIM